MNKKQLLFVAALFCSTFLFSQPANTGRIPMIGDDAPAFVGESTMGTVNFPDDYYGKWKILFSHPADFTPVCSTEILELAKMQDEFADLKTQIIVMSTDGLNSHIQWVESLEAVNYGDWQNLDIGFPIVADNNLVISNKYGMIHPHTSTNKNVRGVFIIDPENIIQAFFFYPVTTGRNLEEIKRTLIALQLSDRKDVLTPVNWNMGDDVLLPSPETKEKAEKLIKKNDPDLHSINWYTWFMKM